MSSEVQIDRVDLLRLRSWLDQVGVEAGPLVEIAQLGGGTHNILVRFARGDRHYVLRRPPLYKREASDETMRREARILDALVATDVPHPRFVAFCDDLEVLGANFFFVMEAAYGVNPTVALPAGYVANASWRHELGLAMADGAARIGTVDHVAVGFEGLGRPANFLGRQVARWRSQLESYAQLDNYAGADLPSVTTVAGWLESNQPTTFLSGPMHGDFHFAIVLCDPPRPRLVAIVDWELTTTGNLLRDLGWLLATWPSGEIPLPISAMID
jgi:aminoglycoside phosphotransferase (APT) family kinase protein